MKKGKVFGIVCCLVAAVVFLLTAVTPVAVTAGVREADAKKKKSDFQPWEYWDNKIALFREENKSAKDVDVVFLGDSLTDLCDVKTCYPDFNALNRGIGGDTTTGLLHRMDVSVYDAHPKAVVMMIGINNFDTMMDDYGQILKEFQKNIPEAKIVILSLTPCDLPHLSNDRIIRRNGEIKALATGYGYTYVDVFSPLYDELTGKSVDGCLVDGLHYTDEGYRRISATLTPVLNGILGKN